MPSLKEKLTTSIRVHNAIWLQISTNPSQASQILSFRILNLLENRETRRQIRLIRIPCNNKESQIVLPINQRIWHQNSLNQISILQRVNTVQVCSRQEMLVADQMSSFKPGTSLNGQLPKFRREKMNSSHRNLLSAQSKESLSQIK